MKFGQYFSLKKKREWTTLPLSGLGKVLCSSGNGRIKGGGGNVNNFKAIRNVNT